ncbi:MAG: extracellular solute-binding protein [Oscillospiraceae bacterium]|nr:extracellular solute-binding protein [Oscillospiraceae bacterium]
MNIVKATAALLFTLSILFVTGCSIPKRHITDKSEVPQNIENKTIRLTIWGEPQQQELLREMCKAFTDNNRSKHYAISFSAVDTDDCAEEVLDSITQAADIFFFSSCDIKELVSEGALAAVNGSSGVLQSCFGDALKCASEKGRIYGYPCEAKTCFLYYDKTKFTEDEADNLDIMLQKDIGAGLNIAADIKDELCQMAFFLGAGCRPLSDDGFCPEKCDFNSSAGFLAGEYLLRLTADNNFISSCDDRKIKRGFADGSISAAISCTENCDEIKSSLGKNYSAAKLPKITLSNGETVQLISTAEYILIGINSASAAKDEAEKLAQWLAGTECQRKMLEKLSAAPTDTLLMNDKKLLSGYPEVSALIQQLEHSVPRGSTECFSSAAEDFAQAIISNEVTKHNLQEALDGYVGAVLLEASEND